LPNKVVSVMQADSRGNVWLGFATGEIVLFDGATFHTFSAADNLPGGAPNSISVDRDGTAWIASERGLARYSGGRFASWSRKNGLPGNRVLWAARDAGGHVWLGYTIGVASVANEDLSRAAADPRFIVPHKFYDDGDGLRSNPDRHGSSPVAVTPDGRIWFTTSEGLATIDPAHIHKNLVPPLAGILEVKADDVDQDITRPIKLAPRTHRIEIKYTGLSLSDARKVTFRYQLLNFDSDWQQAGTLRSATYTNLPPGEYRFQVLAANGDGVWSVTPATLMFTLPPAVYQTKLFIAACVVALLLTAILLVRMRVRATADRLRERFEERLDERARVAQDLHDNLLQDVMGISLQLEIADELTPAGTAGKPMLTRALQLSESALAEGRGALTTLRLTALAAQDVLQAVLVVAAPFTQDRRKAIRCSVEGTEIPLRAGIGEEIVQIAREALRNALRHTQGPVDVQLRYARNSFTLVVADVGTGISPAILKSGVAEHFGLTGMRERAARIAATLTIDSTESGTRVRLSIPARMAYSGSDVAAGMWARFKARWAGTRIEP
jgi:signal transduction histidine kinase